jgi:membrane protease YdiL (CAAX protease family)
MTIFDHLFVFVFVIIYPIAGYIGFKRLLKRVAGGATINRGDMYRTTAIYHWTLFLVALILWSNSARPWSGLGIEVVVDGWFLAALGLTSAAIVSLVVQVRQVATAGQADVAKLRAQFGKLALIIPQNGNELARFNLLSITAGIVEELLWRGFLIWYLGQFMPLWAAAIISGVGFGLAHAYQGLEHLPKLALVGCVFAGLYLLSGSIWLPMILHAALDILQGRLAYNVISRSDGTDNGMNGLSAEATP